MKIFLTSSISDIQGPSSAGAGGSSTNVNKVTTTLSGRKLELDKISLNYGQHGGFTVNGTRIHGDGHREEFKFSYAPYTVLDKNNNVPDKQLSSVPTWLNNKDTVTLLKLIKNNLNILSVATGVGTKGISNGSDDRKVEAGKQIDKAISFYEGSISVVDEMKQKGIVVNFADDINKAEIISDLGLTYSNNIVQLNFRMSCKVYSNNTLIDEKPKVHNLLNTNELQLDHLKKIDFIKDGNQIRIKVEFSDGNKPVEIELGEKNL